MFEGFEHIQVQTSDPECMINLRYGGSGPPVLLLHGNPLTLVTWYLIAPRLAKNFTVVCADLRGYGDSSKPRGNRMDRASSQLYQASDTGLMIAAGNRGQHERLFEALGRPDLAAQSSHEERERLYEQQTAELDTIIAGRTAGEW